MVKHDNPFSFEKNFENLKKAGIKLTDGYKKPIIFRKGKNRITVFVGDREYFIPSWISYKGNLCFKIGGVVYAKNSAGQIFRKDKRKWVLEENVTTKARVPT